MAHSDTSPENRFEALSYELNKFRERRVAERRAQQRDTPDRRANARPDNGAVSGTPANGSSAAPNSLS